MASNGNIEDILKKLTDPDDDVREEAAASLVGTDNPVALVPLMTASNDPHPGVKYFAKKALKQLKKHISETVGIDDEEEISSPSVPETSSKPQDTFDETLKEIEAVLEETPPEVKVETSSSSSSSDNSSPSSPSSTTKKEENSKSDDGTSSYNFDKMFESVAKKEPPSKDGMTDDIKAKIDKIQAIADSGDVSKLPSIIKILENEKNKFLIATLVKTIGKMGNKTHMKYIIEYLKDDDTRVVANCIESLEMLGNPKCVEPLLKLVGHADNRVRANSVKAIWSYAHSNPLANKLIIDRLKEMIFSSKSQMRESAIYVLGEIASEEALDLLSLSLNDSVESVRTKAQAAVKKIEESLKKNGKIKEEVKIKPKFQKKVKKEVVTEKEKTTPQKKSSKSKKTTVSKSKKGGSDDPVPPKADSTIIDIDKKKKKSGKKATTSTINQGSGERKNPLKMVKVISLIMIILVVSILGGLYYYTKGDFTKIGIPINLSSSVSIDENQEKEEKINNDDWKTHYDDGNSYLDEGFYNEAIKEFKAVLKFQPENEDAKKGIATSHMKRGEEFSNLEFYNKASDEFREVLKWSGKSSDLYRRAKKHLEDISKSIK